MLACQLDYIAAMSQGKTAEMTDAARRVDSASHAHLNKLRARPENAECFDCSSYRPGWAVLPHGVFVCIDCAQLHRSMGRHISQTKAINTGTYLWYPHEIRVMDEVGNAVAARAFNAHDKPKPNRDASAAEKLAYVKSKYDSPSPAPDFVRAAATKHKSLPQTKVASNEAPPMQTLSLSRAPSTMKKGLKGALRSCAPPAEVPQPASDLMAEPRDLILFDEPAVLPPKPCPSAADRDFFAGFGL